MLSWKRPSDHLSRKYDEFVFRDDSARRLWSSACSSCMRGETVLDPILKLRWVDSLSCRILEDISQLEGVECVKLGQMCDEFRAKNQPPEGR